MQTRFSMAVAGFLLLMSTAVLAASDDKIQAYIDSRGRLVYTNLADSEPAAAPAPVPAKAAAPSPNVLPKVPQAIHALIDVIANDHGVDPGLVRAVIKTESDFDRWAVSPKGAMGLMQLIPATGARFGVKDFFDPRQNIEGGVRYLKFLLDKFEGNLDLSLAAYNAGENLVQRIGRIPSIPETRNYVRKVRSIYDTAPGKQFAAEAARPKLYRSVDERGVVHFSNIEPPQ